MSHSTEQGVDIHQATTTSLAANKSQGTISDARTSQDESAQTDEAERPNELTKSETDTRDANERQERFQRLALCVPLYQAALRGNWQEAKAVLDKYPDAFKVPITEMGDTVLHIAATTKWTTFVKELMKHMEEDDLKRKNKAKQTALYIAAASGNVTIAKELAEKRNELTLIHSGRKRTPLNIAALMGRREMVSFLFRLTSFKDLSGGDGGQRIELLLATISNDFYDIALEILKMDPSLATAKGKENKTALHVLARKPLSIGSKSQLSVWKRCLNSRFKWIFNKALMQTLAHQLVEDLWRNVRLLKDEDFSDHVKTFLFDAAETGNVELLTIIIRSYPNLMWKRDEQNRSIFHIAVLNRQESVFNLIYEIGAIKDMLLTSFDGQNQNILHLAGKLAPPNRLNMVSGAALQMQRELLWFKAVEKMVWPSYVQMKSSIDKKCNDDKEGEKGVDGKEGEGVDGKEGEKGVDGKEGEQGDDGKKGKDGQEGKTPWDLFTDTHNDLKTRAETWMKDTANYCMIVATLIATVVFAAAFTVPGGTADTGTPVFLKSKWFMVFFISDAIALLCSSTSILMFLSILTSRFAEDDFLYALPGKLVVGLAALFISIAGMVTAFSATCFLVYKGWIPIVIMASASVPVGLFVALHRQLWVETIHSFWSGLLFGPSNRRLFFFGRKRVLF